MKTRLFSTVLIIAASTLASSGCRARNTASGTANAQTPDVPTPQRTFYQRAIQNMITAEDWMRSGKPEHAVTACFVLGKGLARIEDSAFVPESELDDLDGTLQILAEASKDMEIWTRFCDHFRNPTPSTRDEAVAAAARVKAIVVRAL
jgi:hypothetical protein